MHFVIVWIIHSVLRQETMVRNVCKTWACSLDIQSSKRFAQSTTRNSFVYFRNQSRRFHGNILYFYLESETKKDTAHHPIVYFCTGSRCNSTDLVIRPSAIWTSIWMEYSNLSSLNSAWTSQPCFGSLNNGNWSAFITLMFCMAWPYRPLTAFFNDGP